MQEEDAENEVLLDCHYFPCVAFFAGLYYADNVQIEINEHYHKQTLRNRCYIKSANKVHPLTVPISRGSGKIKTKDIKISYHQSWQNNHWRTIKAAYGNAPFFDFFACDFHDIIYKNYRFLIDLNLDLLSKCLALLEMNDKSVTTTQDYHHPAENQPFDLRNSISYKNKNDRVRFFRPKPYHQVFGKDFVPNLSVIDLLFCEGSRAKYVISQSLSSNR